MSKEFETSFDDFEHSKFIWCTLYAEQYIRGSLSNYHNDDDIKQDLAESDLMECFNNNSNFLIIYFLLLHHMMK